VVSDNKPATRVSVLSWRRLRRHVGLYVCVIVVLIAIDLVFAGVPSWLWWTIALWGVAIGFHYLLVKSAHVDEVWGERRAERIRRKSYDLGHIDQIEKSYKSDTMPGHRETDHKESPDDS
jgi:Na+/melibiose symporter-like transporter